MSALTRLTAVEARLFLRDPGSAFWGLAFPTLLLLVIGFVFPGARQASPDLDSYRLVDLYAPISLALAKIHLYAPDVVLMDLRMPVMDGVSAIRALSEGGGRARVLVLTTFGTDRDVLPAIEAGATGFLLKDAPRDDLLRAVRAAARGETVLSPSVGARLLDRVRQPARETVTDRELEVLRPSGPRTSVGCWHLDTTEGNSGNHTDQPSESGIRLRSASAARYANA